MTTTRLIHFYGTFKGLYEWGKGWSRETMEKWNEFWREEFPKMADYQWIRYIPSDEPGICGTLCGRDINIYMHPMAIYGYMYENGFSCGAYVGDDMYNYAFYDELEKLNEICKAAAEWCGGTFTLDTTKEFRVEVPEERFIFKEKDTYLKNCAEKKESYW